MSLHQRIFEVLYRRKASVEQLPWHREEPSAVLQRVVQSRARPGRALDVGCGEGVSSAYLAGQGYFVTGLDFVPAALDFARARARQVGASVEFVQCDVVDFAANARFDVVLDSGCLHHIPRGRIGRYCARLDEWLSADGDYVLVHFGKHHVLDWRPAGPRRTPKGAIERLFPGMVLHEYEETFYDVGPFFGRRALAGVFWFKRRVGAVGQ